MAVVLTYYFTTQTKPHQQLKGYEVFFPYKCSDGDMVDEFIRSRKFKTYVLNTNNAYNDSVIKLVREALKKIKLTNDSINGVHVQFSDNTSYKYYLQTIEICVENTKLFLPFENNIYAACRTKYQKIKDSL
ncbi:MAG: hypothetical protein IT236_14310, partial [Bacteroidia bacterium]|nr:hypothetical protein [Bacteroidia bacterium]